MAALKVGALAKRVGITVRTLHHYHRIGLVVPSARTGAGHRLYGERDIRRLTQVMLLRGLGLSLDDVALVLARTGRGPTMRDLLQRHVTMLQQRMSAEGDVRRRMEGLLHLMQARRGDVSVEEALDLLEAITMIESYYTPEQLEHMRKRRDALGEEGMREVEREWPELIRLVTAEMNAGTDPADPRVQALARRWKQFIEMFTGGDKGIKESVGRLWKEKGPEMAGKFGMQFDPRVFEYVGKAQKLLRD